MPRRPNILILMSDQEQGDVVRPDHPCQTPSSDRLAREGVRFTRARTPATHCCPARASFFSGVYPSRHGVFNNVSNPTAIHRSLNPGVTLFSEPLREAGYRLAFAGKWHVCDSENPADRGWEELGITAGKGSYMHRSFADWRSQADEPEPSGPRRRGEIRRPGWGSLQLYDSYPSAGKRGYEDHPDYAVVRSAVAELPRLAAGDEPWCLFIGLVGPHDPYVIPERYARMYDPAEVPLPASYADALADKPAVYRRQRQQYWGQLSPDETREAIAHYWGFATMVDDMFGEVLDALDATGQADDTLVLRLSDHGDYCGAHGLWMKGVAPFREAYNVPAIVRWPNGIARPGRVVDEFVTLADFAPTILEVAGVPDAYPTDGHSLAPFLRDEAPTDWPDAFCSQFNGVELYYSQRVVETKAHKYVYNGFDFDELYDLERDPAEMVNVADDPAYAGAKRDLVRRMWRFGEETRDFIFNPYGTVALAPWGPADALRGD